MAPGGARAQPRCPRRAGALAALLALVLGSGAAHAQPVQVVVVKRAGLTTYEEVAEEFGERCRVNVRVISFGDDNAHAPLRFGADDLVVTVGQEALDLVAGTRAHVIPTLAFHVPANALGVPSSPPPEVILRMLATALPGRVHTVGAVYGPRAQATLQQATQAAERLGIKLQARRVASGPEAVRALDDLARHAHVDALWLPGDSDVVTAQVFQFGLRLQIERGLPLAAATRQQVHSGALMAADFDPRAAGRVAAELANRFLDGRGAPSELAHNIELYGDARVTVSALTARRLGVEVSALTRLGARLE